MANTRSGKSSDQRGKWLKRIADEERAHKDFRQQAEDAETAYFADRTPYKANKPEPLVSYPLFASTVKVIHGRVFSQPPKPDVRKRYADEPATKPAQGAGEAGGGNPGGIFGGISAGGSGTTAFNQGPQQAGGFLPGASATAAPTVDDNKLAQCIERALTYTIDTTDFDADSHAAVNDLLVTALGIAKIEMETETEDQPVTNPMTGLPILLDKETGAPIDMQMMFPVGVPDELPEGVVPAMQSVIVDQCTKLRHFSWRQFHWEPQQNWSQVSWLAYDHWMTKAAIEERFKVTLDTDGGNTRESNNGVVGGDPHKPEAAKYKDLFCVHEIWDKKKRERLFVTQSFMEGLLAIEDDPLGLKDFFPCPKPMMLNIRGDDLVPMPDYTYCAALFMQCNQLTNRISAMIKQLKDVGFYDASMPEIAQIKGNPPDGTLIPIAGLAQRLQQAGGMPGQGSFDSILARQNNGPIAEVIQQLLMVRENMKQMIWEIYGVSDIQRGSTDPNETATAQTIKAQWADVRIGEKVRIVALFFRDVFRIQAEIMAERFEPDILEKMTGITLNDAEVEVLRSDYGRCYAIDVESDSTVVQDEFAEKQQRLEFLNTITGFIEKIMPAMQAGQMPAELGKELLTFALDTFKNGRQLEQAIQGLPGQAQQLAQMNQKIQTLTQQLDAANKQAQAAQKQLQAVNMGKEQRENVKTMSDTQAKAVDNERTAAETDRTRVETANMALDIGHKAAGVVVPLRPEGA